MFYKCLIVLSTLVLINYFRWRLQYLYSQFTFYLLFYTFSELLVLSTGIMNTYFIAWKRFEKDVEPRVKIEEFLDINDYPVVDIFLLTCGEPFNIVKDSIDEILEINYPESKLHIIICDDGKSNEIQNYVSGLSNIKYKNRFKEIGHAKAGNINDTLLYNLYHNHNPDFVLILDADMQCHPEILNKLVSRFYEGNDKLAFVQSPQSFSNIEKWDILGQQYKYFYQVVMKSWSKWGCVPCCGTNVLFRYKHLLDIGGFQYGSVTEDFLTSLVLHAKGYETAYVSENLAIGLAPFNLCGFYKQRFRWAFGSLQILPIYFQEFYKLDLVKKWIYFNSSFYIIITPILTYLICNTIINFFFVNQVFGSHMYLYYFGSFSLIHTIILIILYSSIPLIYLIRSFQESVFMINCYMVVLFYYIFRLPYSFELTSKKKKNGHCISFLWCIPYLLYFLGVIYLSRKSETIDVNLIWTFVICIQMLPPFTYTFYKIIESY